jgi:hypothetical protein
MRRIIELLSTRTEQPLPPMLAATKDSPGLLYVDVPATLDAIERTIEADAPRIERLRGKERVAATRDDLKLVRDMLAPLRVLVIHAHSAEDAVRLSINSKVDWTEWKLAGD